MVYGAANQMIKFFVFISNFLIFLFGGLLFGFSLWVFLTGGTLYKIPPILTFKYYLYLRDVF